MRILATLLIALGLLSQQAAMAAEPGADALSECLKDNTSGKDRKDLARWIFVSMSAHPDIRSLANATAPVRDDANKQMANVVTRLLTVNCAGQTRVAMEQGGQRALYASFKTLGEVAMMELTSNPAVSEAIGAYTQFVDKKKIEEVFSGKPAK